MACENSTTQAQPAKVPELSSMRGCQAGLSSLAPPSPVLGHPDFAFASSPVLPDRAPRSFGFEETLDWIVRILEAGQIADMRPQVRPFPARSPRFPASWNAPRHR